MIDSQLVSVIMPLYNASRYVAEAIESIINQTYTNWELIIVNDGSTDNSLEVAKKYENEKIKVFNNSNKGASATRNFGYQKSKGAFIKFFDADDILSKNMLEEQLKLATINENCIISAKWGRFYNDDVSTFKLSPEKCWQTMPSIDWICSSWKSLASMTQPGIFLIPKYIIEKAGLWNEKLSLVDDFEYFARTILESSKVIFSEKSILYYRSGNQNSLSSSVQIESTLNAFEIGTKKLLSKRENLETKQICANLFQAYIYEYYPCDTKLILRAKNLIKRLGISSTNKYKASGLYDIISKILGWKVAKRIWLIRKNIVNEQNQNTNLFFC